MRRSLKAPAPSWVWGPVYTRAGLDAMFWQVWPVGIGAAFIVHGGLV